MPADAVARLVRYADILAEEAIPRGFLGPNEEPRILERHVLEGVALAAVLPSEGRLIDVGSGAGLPGVPMACIRTGPTFFVDSLDKRGDFLAEVLAELGLDGTVVVARAEEAARTELRDAFDLSVSRALAAPAVALELTVPFVKPGGVTATLVTPTAVAPAPGGADPDRSTSTDGDAARSAVDPQEVRKAAAGDPNPADAEVFLATMGRVAGELGAGDVRLLPLEVPGADAPRWGMIVNKLRSTPDRFPRRTGIPTRRPLG